MPHRLPFSLLDVFAAQPLQGNSLSVFPLEEGISDELMQALTREMRQFESIFMRQGSKPTHFSARIFTMEEELGFAGHPILGAAVAMHRLHFADRDAVTLHIATPEKNVSVASSRRAGTWFAEMNQGQAQINAPLAPEAWESWCNAMGVSLSDLAPGLPLQVVSTGLPYLILPVHGGLEHAAVSVTDLESRLAAIGAKFTYVLDVTQFEGRTWDNAGAVEDAATGSAAGPVAAYLVQHGIRQADEEIVLTQGRFVHRPSELRMRVLEDGVRVAGQVVPMGGGALEWG